MSTKNLLEAFPFDTKFALQKKLNLGIQTTAISSLADSMQEQAGATDRTAAPVSLSVVWNVLHSLAG